MLPLPRKRVPQLFRQALVQSPPSITLVTLPLSKGRTLTFSHFHKAILASTQEKTTMASMLPEDLSQTLLDQIPCRTFQTRQLLALLSVRLPIRLSKASLTSPSPPSPVPPQSSFTASKRQGRALSSMPF